jgi:hypothetical protein
MGQVKKSIKKFQAKGGDDAAKKANRKRKVEAAKRTKRSDALDTKKVSAWCVIGRRGGGLDAEALMGMHVQSKRCST